MGGPWKPELAAAAQKRYRQAHPEKVRALHSASYARSHDLLDRLKAASCMDCGRRFPPECMDFDHVRGEKRFSVGGSGGRTVEAIMREVAKCDVVCSNCHRIRTRARGMVYPRRNVA